MLDGLLHRAIWKGSATNGLEKGGTFLKKKILRFTQVMDEPPVYYCQANLNQSDPQ